MAKKKTAAKKWTCVLCGRRIYNFETGNVIGSTGRMVCKECLKISERLLRTKEQTTSLKEKKEESKAHILTPREIIQKLDEAIIGQEKAKQAVAVALWKQQLRTTGESVPRMNLMLYGPTGCGKTAIVQEAARIVGLPFLSVDATTLSETGYRGKDAEDIIKDLVERYKGNPKLSYSVIFLDECDKLAAQGGDQRQAYNRGTQHSLLKLVEGSEVNCDGIKVSTGGMLFIFGGAFSGMKKESRRSILPIGFDRKKEDFAVEQDDDSLISAFISYGMEAELMGRIGQYVAVESLRADDLKRILMHSKLSALQQYKTFFCAHNVQLEFSENCLDELVERALSRGTGARGLNTLVEEAVEPWLLRLANGELKREKEVEISCECDCK